MSYVFMDTETTGHDDGDLIQIAVLNPFGESFVRNVAPTRAILPCALFIHGITNEKASTFPAREAVAAEFRDYVQKQLPPGVVVIGHNIAFDVDIVTRSLHVVPQRTVDTLRLAKKLIPMDKIGGYRLDHVYTYLFPEKLTELHARRNTHDAMVDCQITEEVYYGLVKLLTASVPDAGVSVLSVMEWANQPMLLTTWPFGKHKGKPLDCDWDYAGWYLRQADKDPDLVYSLDQMRAKRPGARYTRR